MPLQLPNVPNLGQSPTNSEVIAQHLRSAIVTGQLREGEPIRQDEVAALFKVSKIPVREALKHLEAEGLVAFQRNRGAVVHSLSESEIVGGRPRFGTSFRSRGTGFTLERESEAKRIRNSQVPRPSGLQRAHAPPRRLWWSNSPTRRQQMLQTSTSLVRIVVCT